MTEKVLARGQWVARTMGVALTLLGVAVAIHPGLAPSMRSRLTPIPSRAG